MFEELMGPWQPQASVFFSPDVTSEQPNYRMKIRQALYKTLSDTRYRTVDESTILNLEKLPSVTGMSISISHSKQGAAFAFSYSSMAIGIDIESPERINDSLIERLSSEEERKGCPNPRWLFTAKEACWKATNLEFKIETVSQIETYGWTTLNPNMLQFSAKTEKKQITGHGFSTRTFENDLSFFILS
jgi:phosphopantetheinyl transferase (holo-ACP synthase)